MQRRWYLKLICGVSAGDDASRRQDHSRISGFALLCSRMLVVFHIVVVATDAAVIIVGKLFQVAMGIW